MKVSDASTDRGERQNSLGTTRRRIAALMSLAAVLTVPTGWGGGGSDPLAYRDSAFGRHSAYSTFPRFEARMEF